MTWLTVPAKYGTSVNEDKYFWVTQHLSGNIRKFIVFVCTWTTIPNCSNVLQSVFRSGSSHMDHCTALYGRVGLAQACPNYEHMQLTNSTKNQQYITYACVLNEVYVLNNHVHLITWFYSISNYHAQGKIKLFILILSMLGSMSLEDDLWVKYYSEAKRDDNTWWARSSSDHILLQMLLSKVKWLPQFLTVALGTQVWLPTITGGLALL